MALKIYCLAAIAALTLTIPSHAAIIDVPDVTIHSTQFRAFQDTATGATWLDLDNFFYVDYSFNSLNAYLAGTGFHIATRTEIDALALAAPASPANWTTNSIIMGANYTDSPYAPGGRNLAWGIYDDGDPSDGIAYFYHYGGDSSWSECTDCVTATEIFRFSNETEVDLGAWVTGAAAPAEIPEPGTFAMLALAAAAAALKLRR